MSGGGFFNVIQTIGGQIANTISDAAGNIWNSVAPIALTVGGIAIATVTGSVVLQLGTTLALVGGGLGLSGYVNPPFGGLMKGILGTIPILGPAVIQTINTANHVLMNISQTIGVPYVYIGWCSDDSCLIPIV